MKKLEDAKMAFVDVNEAEQAYEAGHIGLQTPIRLRVGEIAGDATMHGEIKNRFADLITERSSRWFSIIKYNSWKGLLQLSTSRRLSIHTS